MALITDDQITRLAAYKETRQTVEPGVSITGIEFYWTPAAILDDILNLGEQYHALSFDYDALHRDFHDVEDELQDANLKLTKLGLVLYVLEATGNPSAPTVRKILEGAI